MWQLLQSEVPTSHAFMPVGLGMVKGVQWEIHEGVSNIVGFTGLAIDSLQINLMT